MSGTTHEETLEVGMRLRREVLGDAHVDASLEKASEFGRPIQELVTEYCWGTVWADDGLPKQTRSLINLAMLTALNRPHELATHVRGALNNGVQPAQIQAVLMQTAIYVGVPAALESFRIAERVLTEHGVDV
ncbi:carboxymuconolactone decarboxylase family protein [Microbacterium sp.]|jgi:4-carboxymuconolactone decarboxylase|uniref:carboxymuconolactone decarboxylase family protein n=1 Tax=Microbacterium sp. TaxID=51671 RepID=UPI002732CF0C|nr:carboxymuconolactone decarboxylase family protein [Microbacterium sp.]MDP3951846.1 carboxymuconolactone decarboxylase family protein [Microbacterium sp.]